MRYSPEQNYLNEQGQDFIEALLDYIPSDELESTTRLDIGELYKTFNVVKNVDHDSVLNYYKQPSVIGNRAERPYFATTTTNQGVFSLKGCYFDAVLLNRFHIESDRQARLKAEDLVNRIYKTMNELDKVAKVYVDFIDDDNVWLRVSFFEGCTPLTIDISDVYQDEDNLANRITIQFWRFFGEFTQWLSEEERTAINAYWTNHYSQQDNERFSIFHDTPVTAYSNRHCHVSVVRGYPYVSFINSQLEVVEIFHGEKYIPTIPFSYAYMKRFYTFCLEREKQLRE